MVILKLWHHVVSLPKDALIQLDIQNDRFRYKSYKGAVKWNGYYAAYSEGLFLFFNDHQGRIFIGWKNALLNVEQISESSWFNGVTGIHFEVKGLGGQALMSVKYHTLRRYLFDPLALLLDFFDDDFGWFMVADLPGDIHCYLKNGNDVATQLKRLIAEK